MGDTETTALESDASNLLSIFFPITEENMDGGDDTCTKHCHSDSCCVNACSNSESCYKTITEACKHSDS